MLHNTTQGQRIKLARKAKDLTQTELAHKVGIKGHQVIQHYERDKRGTEHPNLALLVKVAEICEVSIDWLLTGNEKIRSDIKNNAENYPAIQNFAPIIGWDEIHTWRNVRNTMSLARCERVPLFSGEGSNCFGLRVRDDSMVSNAIDGDSFKEGDIVIIDPDVKVGIDDYIVASFIETETPVLRRFVLTTTGSALRALNRSYPDQLVTDKVIIYGVVVGQHRKFTRKT